MAIEFLYEDGHGNAYDESGSYAYDVEMKDDANDLECLVSMTAYNDHQSRQAANENDNDTIMSTPANEPQMPKGTKKSPAETYNSYSDQQGYKFIILLIEKQLDAATASRALGIHPRTGQRWRRLTTRTQKDKFLFQRRMSNEDQSLSCSKLNARIMSLDSLMKMLLPLFLMSWIV